VLLPQLDIAKLGAFVQSRIFGFRKSKADFQFQDHCTCV